MSNNISYTQIVSIILKEINKIRNQPTSFIPILKQRLKKYDEEGNYYPLYGLNFSVKSKQGKKGVQDLIQYLQTAIEMHPLKWSFQLHQAADKRSKSLRGGQQNQSNSIANMEIGALVHQFAQSKGHLVQLTFFGFIEPRQLICELLLEDGRPIKCNFQINEENRRQIFNIMSNLIGIGLNTHEKYRFVVVIIMGMHIAKKQSWSGDRKNSDFTGSSIQQTPICGNKCQIF